MTVTTQQNRGPSDPLSDGETGLVNARSRLCFGFIKLVLVLEHLNTVIGLVILILILRYHDTAQFLSITVDLTDDIRSIYQLSASAIYQL